MSKQLNPKVLVSQGDGGGGGLNQWGLISDFFFPCGKSNINLLACDEQHVKVITAQLGFAVNYTIVLVCIYHAQGSFIDKHSCIWCYKSYILPVP